MPLGSNPYPNSLRHFRTIPDYQDKLLIGTSAEDGGKYVTVTMVVNDETAPTSTSRFWMEPAIPVLVRGIFKGTVMGVESIYEQIHEDFIDINGYLVPRSIRQFASLGPKYGNRFNVRIWRANQLRRSRPEDFVLRVPVHHDIACVRPTSMPPVIDG